MPVEDSVGYGELTPLKIEHLTKIIEMHSLITQAVLKKHPYFQQQYRYIDLTAGRGISPNGIREAHSYFYNKQHQATFKFRINFGFP